MAGPLTATFVGEPAAGLPGRYVGYQERAEGVLTRREPAGAFAVLILGWGAPLDVADPRAADRGVSGVSSFLAGTFDSYAVTRTAGVGLGLQLVLDPLVAGRLLGVPMGELANRAVRVDDLPGRWLTGLAARLAEAGGWPARFDVLDAVLSARLAATAPADPRVEWAWRRLAATHGRLTVGELAAELGWSRRHLTATFRRSVGLPPKLTARLLRFQRARALLARPGRPGGLAGLAADAGYYDQAHLIRDVREFTGDTPTGLRLGAPAGRRVTFVQSGEA